MAASWEPPKFALSSVVYLERDGRILLLKRAAGSAMAGQWFLPGGAVDPGEQPEEAARRELVEESGLEVAGELEMVGCYTMWLYGHDFLQLSFRGRAGAGDPVVSAEHDGARWVDPVEMRAFLTDEVIDAMAGGDERITIGVRRVRDDLDRYLRRAGLA